MANLSAVSQVVAFSRQNLSRFKGPLHFGSLVCINRGFNLGALPFLYGVGILR